MKKEKKQITIERFLHVQFVKIGLVVGIVQGLLGLFTIYEGVKLARMGVTGYKTSITMQTILTVVIIGSIVAASIILIDQLLHRVAVRTIRRIKSPVGIMDDTMRELAVGNLDYRIDYDSVDEFADMMGNAEKAMEELKKYIHNISFTLEQISDKNMDIAIEEEYVGDFVRIQESLCNILDSLNTMLYEMKSSFLQVRDGASTLADTAQAMSNGAEKQSSHMKKLVEHITKVAESVHENTVAAQGVEELSQDSMKQMAEGEQKMEELTAAMEQIRTESDEIASIIEVITGIAAQTNLLALNASIEAARAGEHGKGFAVVAGEIGTLAGSSAEAAQNITELIQKSLSAVNHGVTITGETVEMLAGISKISSKISQNIEGISSASRNQDEYLEDMLSDTNEVASIIDQNTASAQECSALSEELLGYSENVMSLIDQYKIYEDRE